MPAVFTGCFLFLPLDTLTIACMPQLSVWEKETFFAPQHIIIIGSGFVGLWSALKLANKYPGKKITILERGIIPTGASTRNAGFSCFGSPSELLNDVAAIGENKTFELVEMRYKGLREVQQYFDNDSTGFDASGGYECFIEGSADWQLSESRLQWLNEKMKAITGEAQTFNVADDKLSAYGFTGFDHLIENKLEGGLHSGKIIKALLLAVQSRGVQVLTGINVKKFEKVNGSITIETDQQISFTCNQLLICTNAFTKALLPDADIIPCRGQVLLTNEIPGLRMKGTFHFDKGFYYFRNLGNRILLGGARNLSFREEETLEIDTTAVIQEELQSFISRHLLPHTPFVITDRWSGIMAMGSEKLPIVKAIDDGIFCCVRMSGMGVALAPVVAEDVIALMNIA